MLSNNWAVLKTTTLDFQRNDGTWQEQKRETYDRGHGATILLYNIAKRAIILVRQFRYPLYVTGYDALMIETPAGKLDDLSPLDCIRARVRTGNRLPRAPTHANIRSLHEPRLGDGTHPLFRGGI